jgi:hypothetical protein
MNQQDDDKATAKLLLSTDEAVAEKIRRVLMNHPAILRETIKNMQLEDERQRYDLQRQMYMNSQAAQSQAQAQNAVYQARDAYNVATQGQIGNAQGFWNNVFGGKK